MESLMQPSSMLACRLSAPEHCYAITSDDVLLLWCFPKADNTPSWTLKHKYEICSVVDGLSTVFLWFGSKIRSTIISLTTDKTQYDEPCMWPMHMAPAYVLKVSVNRKCQVAFMQSLILVGRGCLRCIPPPSPVHQSLLSLLPDNPE